MEFDYILYNYLGEIGWYQVLLFIMLGAMEFMGAESISMNFIGGRLGHWCSVPELANFSHSQQKNVASPYESGNEYSGCKMFSVNYSQYDVHDFLSWNRTEAAAYGQKDCDQGWVYDKSIYVSNIRMDWNLVCGSDWMNQMVSSVYMAGRLFGAITGGALADKIGRKYAVLGYVTVKTGAQFMATFAPNYAVFIIGRFLMAFGTTGANLCAFVIILEVTGEKYRALLGVMWSTVFSVGYMGVALIGYFVRDHVKFQAVVAFPCVIYWIYAVYVDESPRWLISQGRYKEAETIIRKIAVINKRVLPDNLKLDEMSASEEKEDEGTHHKGTLLDLFRNPNICVRSFIMFFTWFSTSLMYYGLSLNADKLSDNVYLNTFLMGLVEIPANFLCIFLLDRIGRRWVLSMSLVFGGITSFICMPLAGNKDAATALIILSLVGKMAVTMTFSGIYVWVIELYPTAIRNFALGASSMSARVSGMAAPFVGGPMSNIWAPLPSLVYGVCATFSGLLSLLLPETLHKNLPETIEEAEEFGRLCGKPNLNAQQIGDHVYYGDTGGDTRSDIRITDYTAVDNSKDNSHKQSYAENHI